MYKVYISGKISGLPMEEVAVKFEKAERFLAGCGYSVVNPVKLDHSDNPAKNWEAYMKTDIKALMDCNYIALLPCWRQSPGALIEFYIAQRLNYAVITLDDLTF